MSSSTPALLWLLLALWWVSSDSPGASLPVPSDSASSSSLNPPPSDSSNEGKGDSEGPPPTGGAPSSTLKAGGGAPSQGPRRQGSWSWAKGIAPTMQRGVGVASEPVQQLRAMRSARRAGSIISATAVAFDEAWRVGVNKTWYATRGWGWRHPDNWKDRTYKCVYGMDGRPCGPWSTFSEMWPANVHCLPDQCCSRVHVSLFFARQVCTNIGSLCVIIFDRYSWGQCRCQSTTCPAESDCVEEIEPHGGVYCKCKEGKIGNGIECYDSLCEEGMCSPGTCVQDKTEIKCECPVGYEVSGLSCQEIPMCSRGIENLCGPPERVLECVNIGRTDWTCVCAPGYAVVNTTAGKQCDLASNALYCSDKPCGTEGVQSCEDNAGGGVTCTCTTGYLLEKQDDGLHFKCTAIDPCKTQPCGSETVVKSCSRTAGGSYFCECQDSAELVEATATEGPYCKAKEEQVNVLPYVGVAAGGIALLAIGVGVWWFSFKSGNSAQEEFDYTKDPFAGAMAG